MGDHRAWKLELATGPLLLRRGIAEPRLGSPHPMFTGILKRKCPVIVTG